MSALTHETAAREVWQAYDRLEVGLLSPGRYQVATTPADEWPLLAVYAPNGTIEVRNDRRSVTIGTGELSVIENSGCLAVTCTDTEVVVLRLPAAAVEAHRDQLAAAVGSVWTTHNGTASLVAHLLDGLIEQFGAYRPQSPRRLAQHVIGFIAMMCADAGPIVRQSSHHRTLLAGAKEYVEEHLPELGLSPDLIAQSQNMSTRTLHRLFELDGYTIGGWVRWRRLEHCRADLEDSAFDNHSVSEIGARWGLWDAAYFSRVFKATYGMPPRAYRVAVRDREVSVA